MLVRQAYSLTATDTKFEPFKDPIETEEPQSLPITPAPIPSPDYILATPHTGEESEPMEAYETTLLHHEIPLHHYPLIIHLPRHHPPLHLLELSSTAVLHRLRVRSRRTRVPAQRVRRLHLRISSSRQSQSILVRQTADETPTPRLLVRTTWEARVDGIIYMDIVCIMPLVRAPVQTPASPEWSSGSLPVSPASLTVPSPVAS
ncbi:hypothetical protein Tco_0471647 [Tanacetum coccineum]